MALANKEHLQNDSAMAIIQASAFYEHNFGLKPVYNREPESPKKASGLFTKNFTMSNSSSVSSPSSSNSNGLGYQATAYEEGHSVINFKPEFGNFIHAGGSLLSFEPAKRAVHRNLFPKMIGEEDEYPVWEYQNHDQMNPSAAAHGPPETSSSHHASDEHGSTTSGGPFPWLNDHDSNTITNKRPSMEEDDEQALKKQCVLDPITNASKKTKSKPVSTTKDPQSVAAKNRRERISERLKLLQDLVPNGSKVDLVTMLEKAISYVKFLQLQVKVLATDEFWPAQGEKLQIFLKLEKPLMRFLHLKETETRARNEIMHGKKKGI